VERVALQRRRVRVASAAAGTNRLFYTPAAGSRLKIANLYNSPSTCVVQLDIVGVEAPDDTDRSIALFQHRSCVPGRDVNWTDMEGVEFDGNERLRATFHYCTLADILVFTMGFDRK